MCYINMYVCVTLICTYVYDTYLAGNASLRYKSQVTRNFLIQYRAEFLYQSVIVRKFYRKNSTLHCINTVEGNSNIVPVSIS